MADILIRGVEMPNSCEKCPFNDYEQGFCFAAWKFNESGWPDFSLNVGCQETRNHRCPIVPLPEGHGRLCDWDALIKELQNLFDKREKDAAFSGNRGPSVTWNDAICSIFAAPIIVPAEGGTEDGNS